MIEIKSHSRVVEEISHYIFYEWVEQPDSGFHFPCNDQGEINFNEMLQEALAHYEKCESEEYAVIYRGLQRFVNHRKEPSIGICYCGKEVVLDSGTNECECGNLFNSAGQQLSDPKHWGEETGEHPSDVRRWTR